MSVVSRPSSWLHRAGRLARRDAWVIAIGFLAFLTRFVWNTVVHPPRNYVYSDMLGYFGRAQDLTSQPLFSTHDYLSFYPWGTHVYLGLTKWLFTAPTSCPRDVKDSIAAAGCWPLDVAMAIPGALGVIYTTLLARRLTLFTADHSQTGRRRWVYIAVGLASLCYYPILSQGGYYLSEAPFYACLAAAAFHSLRLADLGKTRDALLFGVFAGIGTWVRPQMLLSVALLFVFWLFRRHRLPGATVRKVFTAAVPLVILLVISAVRTTRHLRAHNPKDFALAATNDALNYTFGRCHATGIEAESKNYRAGFGPPSLGTLHWGARELRKKKQPVFLELRPALPDDRACEVNKKHIEKKEPTEPCILIKGKMWDRDKLWATSRRCIQKTGWAGQAYYTYTHLLLNFGFNRTWPDSSQKLRKTNVLGVNVPTGMPIMNGFQVGFGFSLMPLGLLGCVLAFRKRRARDALIALHMWASVLVAVIYFGETRLRTPYDFVLIVLGLDVLSRVLGFFRRKLGGLAAR